MDFNWTSEQNVLYERMLEFSRNHLNSFLPNIFDGCSAEFSRQCWEQCGKVGLLALSVPEEYGGKGLGTLSTARALEAFGKGCEDGGLLFSVAAHLCATVMPIVEFGHDALKAQFLPKLGNGEWIGANAMTETQAGSDISQLKTQAILEGDNYVLTGTKSYVSNGPVADVYVVYAMTQPQHGSLGISAFLVAREQLNVRPGTPFNTMGLNSTPISSVEFDYCQIPKQQLIGHPGQGSEIFARSMQWERTCLFATYLGTMERQLERTIHHATHRKQSRRPIGKKQAIAHRIADMKLRLESARLLLYRACWLMDQSLDAALEVSMAKLAISESAIQSSLDALHIHGGAGYLQKTGIERSVRDAIPSTIFSGTSEIQRDIIANRLGL